MLPPISYRQPVKPQPAFRGDSNYKFPDKAGQLSTIPADQFSLLSEKLNGLIEKIKTNEYTLEPTPAGRWHKDFRHGVKFDVCNDCHKGRLYLKKGKVTLRPKDPNSDLKAVRVETRASFGNYTIQIQFIGKDGQSHEYHYKDNQVDGVLFEFTNTLAEKIDQIKKGETQFDPDHFKNLSL